MQYLEQLKVDEKYNTKLFCWRFLPLVKGGSVLVARVSIVVVFFAETTHSLLFSLLDFSSISSFQLQTASKRLESPPNFLIESLT